MTHEEHRALDAKVAEKVMGWTVDKHTAIDGSEAWYVNEYRDGRYYAPHGCIQSQPWVGSVSLWQPSRRIADAWQIVEKLHIAIIPTDCYFGWSTGNKAGYAAFQGKNDLVLDGGSVTVEVYEPLAVWAETAPEAICLAALSAVEGETP